MTYLDSLTWFGEPSKGRYSVQGRKGKHYGVSAFPLLLPEPAAEIAHGKAVFPKEKQRHKIYSFEAFDYLCRCTGAELHNRVSPNRRLTHAQRLHALAALYRYVEEDPVLRAARVAEWNTMEKSELRERTWSPEQQEALDTIRRGIEKVDANDEQQNRLFLKGEPGCGKSEVIIHAAVRAALDGYRVLILVPTGTLVHSYRDRLPTHEFITVETIHSGMQIHRETDREKVQYAPPGRLRRIDLFCLDEASQVEDDIATLLFMAVQELPQKPMFVAAADYQQLSPIKSGHKMSGWCQRMPTIELKTIFRTSDPELLTFLRSVRSAQPAKSTLVDFFQRPASMWQP